MLNSNFDQRVYKKEKIKLTPPTQPNTILGMLLLLLLLLLLHRFLLGLLARSPSTLPTRPALLLARTHLALARAAGCTSG